jgi:(4-(4-[2-(gamma-L-glutamylamino)ethyl]phenoxymethyl)furan-2-yl)methanamine synthase
MPVIGWDIGGVNTKAALAHHGVVRAALSRPFEVQRDPFALVPLLTTLARELGASTRHEHAVTMTAELSQMFRTKRDGVSFVLDAVTAAFPDADCYVYAVDGRFLSPSAAAVEPLAVAASNWAATARLVAADSPNAILVDIGTTTTDIIPIVAGRVVAIGATDPERLASGELVYTGALRTPVEAVARHVPLDGATAGVSAEGFALIGDVHLWRGDVTPDDYSVPTPDGRPATRQFAAERIARVVCGDREMLDDAAISLIADAVAAAQVQQVAAGLTRVRARHPDLRTAVVTGLGSFIAARAARETDLIPVLLATTLGEAGARSAPAAAVALLLERELDPSGRPIAAAGWVESPNDRASLVDVVVKIGGGLLADPPGLRTALSIVSTAARETRIAVVPGGGPFAESVRVADAQMSLDDDAAHWMAILGMDQYAHLLASVGHPAFVPVSRVNEIEAAVSAGRAPVIAPFAWLREADPLSHSWDVTSDSISAWIAGRLRAGRLVLVKPAGARGDAVVDPYFATALAPGIAWTVVAGDALDELRAALVD